MDEPRRQSSKTSRVVPQWNPFATVGPIGSVLSARDIHYVVTGASGWLGLAALDILEAMLGGNMQARVRAFASRPRKLRLRSGKKILAERLNAIGELPTQYRYIFLHFAFLKRNKLAWIPPRAYVSQNEAIRQIVVAAAERLNLAGLILPSSGAVYSRDGSLEEDANENPYGFLKHQDELAFADFARRKVFPLTIARVFNLSGFHINKLDDYALGSILVAAMRGRPIKLYAAHRVIRSYADVSDVIKVSLATIADTNRETVTLFETAGEREIEISELARLVVKQVGGRKLEIIRPPVNNEFVDRYVGNPVAFRSYAKRYGIPLRPLTKQISETADYLRQTIERSSDKTSNSMGGKV